MTWHLDKLFHHIRHGKLTRHTSDIAGINVQFSCICGRWWLRRKFGWEK